MPQSRKPSSPSTKSMWWLVLIPAALAFAAILAYHHAFGPAVSSKQEVWGQFGDFLGGIVNPVVGLITIILLVLTLKAQRDELQEQREELKLQRAEAERSTAALDAQYRAIQTQSLEQSLFAWLANYRELLESVVYKSSSFSGGGIRTFECGGRDALTRWYQDYFKDEKLSKNEGYESGMHFEELDSADYPTYDKLIEDVITGNTIANGVLAARVQKAIDQYRLVYEQNRSTFDALFRTLYRLFEWIDSAEVDARKKWHYTSLIRAQLSWIELIFMAYNGLMPEGQKFTRLINRYALFDNITPEADGMIQAFFRLMPQHTLQLKGGSFESANWPYSHSAFSSTLAKKLLNIDAPD